MNEQSHLSASSFRRNISCVLTVLGFIAINSDAKALSFTSLYSCHTHPGSLARSDSKHREAFPNSTSHILQHQRLIPPLRRTFWEVYFKSDVVLCLLHCLQFVTCCCRKESATRTLQFGFSCHEQQGATIHINCSAQVRNSSSLNCNQSDVSNTYCRLLLFSVRLPARSQRNTDELPRNARLVKCVCEQPRAVNTI